MERAASVGHLIEGLDFSQAPPPDEDVVGAVLLLKMRAPDGTIGLRSLWSEDLGWLERVGMHTVAAQAELPSGEDENVWLDTVLDPGSHERSGARPASSRLHAVDTGPDALGDTRPGARMDPGERGRQKR